MEIKLEELVSGGLQENVSRALEKVVTNLQDPNTPWKNKREITIKMKFTQNEDRDDCSCDISVDTKLAPVKPLGTRFNIGKDIKTGKVYAEEYGKQIRGQMSFDDIQKEAQAQTVVIDCNLVDTETGEILNDNVVDLRTAKVQ